MLKRRIIPVQLLSGNRLIKTKRFAGERDVGDPVASAKVYNAQYADELVFLNVSREQRTIAPLMQLLDPVSAVSFMPLAMGGGVRSLSDARQLILNGADKVIVNSAVYENAGLVREIAGEFGSQAVIVGIDVRNDVPGGEPELYSDCGRRLERVSFDRHIDRVVSSGAGELFIHSIDRDGVMEGYDIALLKRAVKCAAIPIIGCGGAGNYTHLRDAFLDAGVSALACGSLFNFSDSNPLRAKAFLKNCGIPCKVI